MEATFTFQAELLADGSAGVYTQIILVPAEVVAGLGGRPNTRVLAELNGHELRRGLLPRAGGQRYLLLGKAVCRACGLQVGDAVNVTLRADPDPDRIDLPAELAEGLEAWPEAETHFQQLAPGLRRTVAYHVASAKRAETRMQRAVTFVERLGRGQHPFRGA